MRSVVPILEDTQNDLWQDDIVDYMIQIKFI